MRSGANLLATVLVGSLLLAATAATSDLPADAMRSGVPALLSKKTAKKWKVRGQPAGDGAGAGAGAGWCLCFE